MKTAMILLLSGCAASAFQLGDLLGNWSGKFTAREEGELASSYSFKIEGVRRSDGGLTLIENNDSKYQFHKSGKFTMTSGVVSAVGRWKRTSSSIMISGNTSNPGGTKPFTAEITMPKDNQFRMVEKVPYYKAVSKWVANRKA